MSIKTQANEIIDQLEDDASWNDLMKELYLRKKVTLGMTDSEVDNDDLSESDVNNILARIKSASSQPDDMRNTKTYEPGNAVTLGMVAGVVAILFSFVFPPISWIAAPVAVVAGLVGLKRKEEKAWVPILLAIVSVGPMLPVVMSS